MRAGVRTTCSRKINNDMQTSIINFNYKGSQISFNRGENVMVNATQMAKPFDKSPKDFLKTDQTKRFILALSEVKKILSSDLVRVVYGDNGGTWMHEDVALEFLSTLSAVRTIPLTGLVDKAFKKILFSFGSMESLRNFVPFTDDDCIRYVKQAVKLLISYMGFFMPLLDIGGCLYVRL